MDILVPPSYPEWLKRQQRNDRIRAAILALWWMVVGGFAAHCLLGCATLGTTVPPRTGAEKAVWIVWTFYGRTDPPPLVRWVEGDKLTCDDPVSGKRGFEIVDLDPGDASSEGILVCREGDTWSPGTVMVAWQGTELSFSETTLAHELEHAELLRRGIFLGHHSREDFQPRIDLANQRLVDSGL